MAARLQQTIYDQMVAAYVASAAAAGITIDPTKWSMYNLQRLLLWTVAGAMAIFEQIFFDYTADVEAIVTAASPQTAPWIQNEVLNVFQYDAATPQIPQLDTTDGTFAPFYNPEDVTKRIITQCVVVPGVFGTTSVKAAKATGVLSGPELSSLQSFLNIMTVPGINVNASSGNADKIYTEGILTYTGGYSATIQVSVPAAITAFLAAIPTSGVVTTVNSPAGLMRLTDLIAAIRAVPGVVDFEPVNINARPDGTPLSGPYNLVNGNDWINPQWQSGLSGAGYMALDSTGTIGTDGVTNITYNSI